MVSKVFDSASFFGLMIICGAFLGSLLVAGGDLMILFQLSAFLIVILGTLGAVMLSFPPHALGCALKSFSKLFFYEQWKKELFIEEVNLIAETARKDGLLGLDVELERIKSPDLRRGVKYLIDGIESDRMRILLDSVDCSESESNQMAAQVYETAAQYAPALGVLGAVIGLVPALTHLEDPSVLGKIIAGAFVATIYGMGLSHLILHPLANKIRQFDYFKNRRTTIIKDVILSVQAGESPKLISEKLTYTLKDLSV